MALHRVPIVPGGPPTPLVRTPPVWALVPIAGLAALAVGLPTAAWLGVDSLCTIVPLMVLAFVLTHRASAALVRRAALELVVEADRVEVRSRYGVLGFPRGPTRARIEVREWTSPRTTGHNLWTVLVLEHGDQTCALGTWGAFGPRVATTGLPTFVLQQDDFRLVAAAFDITVP